MKRRVSILYGLGEGPKIGKLFVQKLQREGFEVYTDPSKADIIIAHSGGACYLPKNYTAKLIFLIGVNYEFSGGALKNQFRKLQMDFAYTLQTKQLWPWLRKSFWNVCYIFGQYKRTAYMWKFAHGKGPLLPSLKNTKVIIINYKDDPWSGSVLKTQLDKFPHYTLLGHKGVHDDMWIHPEYYVNLLKVSLSAE